MQAFPKRWRFSLRSIAATFLCLSVLLAIGSAVFHRSMKRKFIATTIDPITRTFVSSVGTCDGRVIWLRLNALDPHHLNGYDQWAVPAPISAMYINDGRSGFKYSSFHDDDLERVVKRHPYLQALDLRDTAVTEAGMRHVAKLRELKWLWLDDAQCSDDGLKPLSQITTLQSVCLNPDVPSLEAMSELTNALPDCEFTDSRHPDATRERQW